MTHLLQGDRHEVQILILFKTVGNLYVEEHRDTHLFSYRKGVDELEWHEEQRSILN